MTLNLTLATSTGWMYTAVQTVYNISLEEQHVILMCQIEAADTASGMEYHSSLCGPGIFNHLSWGGRHVFTVFPFSRSLSSYYPFFFVFFLTQPHCPFLTLNFSPPPFPSFTRRLYSFFILLPFLQNPVPSSSPLFSPALTTPCGISFTLRVHRFQFNSFFHETVWNLPLNFPCLTFHSR